MCLVARGLTEERVRRRKVVQVEELIVVVVVTEWSLQMNHNKCFHIVDLS